MLKAAAVSPSDYFELNITHSMIHEIANAPRLATLIDHVMRESLLFEAAGWWMKLIFVRRLRNRTAIESNTSA